MAVSVSGGNRPGLVAAGFVGLLALSACGGATDWTARGPVGPRSSSSALSPPSTRFVFRPLATGCEQAAPPGSSADARAYLAAVNAAYPGWVAVTRAMRAEGGLVSVGDLVGQVRVDAEFLGRLRAIRFGPRAEVWAAVLRVTLQQYVVLLSEVLRNVGPTGATDMAVLDERRAEASANLRVVLGLRQSTCDVLRP